MIEENEDNLLLISHVLIFYQHIFVTASDAQTALEIAREHQPYLILIELLFFHTNGLELVRKLKENNLTQNIPIVAVTALAKSEDRYIALNAGCDDYITKPYLIEQINHIIYRFKNSK